VAAVLAGPARRRAAADESLPVRSAAAPETLPLPVRERWRAWASRRGRWAAVRRAIRIWI